MAIAILFTLGFADSMRRMRWVLPLWALIIGFAQVYVGVHFPFDVMVGFTIGLVIGIMVYLLFKSKLGNEKSLLD
jgi:undecaprenyl-diphosphatase